MPTFENGIHGGRFEPRRSFHLPRYFSLAVTVNIALPLYHAFTYRLPDAMDGAAQVGCRVPVPFRNRRLTGLIVEEGMTNRTS